MCHWLSLMIMSVISLVIGIILDSTNTRFDELYNYIRSRRGDLCQILGHNVSKPDGASQLPWSGETTSRK